MYVLYLYIDIFPPNKRSLRGLGGVGEGFDFLGQAKISARDRASVVPTKPPVPVPLRGPPVASRPKFQIQH